MPATVTASKTNQILIQTKIEGEHSEEMLVITRKAHDSLCIDTGFCWSSSVGITEENVTYPSTGSIV